MPAGEAFSARQREDIVRALRLAESEGDLPVSVYVGELESDSRAHAQRLHRRLPAGDRTVLVAVDPGSRRLEIVTGDSVRHRVDDRACQLAAATMVSAFAGGDLSGGIADGVRMLGDHARVPRTLHTDTP